MSRFDTDYYRRFYLDPDTAVATLEEIELRAAAVYHMARIYDAPLRKVLDIGGGIGLWGTALKKLDRGIHYTLMEPSEDAVRMAREERSADLDEVLRESIVDWDGDGRGWDLVLCAGVVQYLDDKQIRRALAHVAGMTRYVLYFETFTEEDVAKRRIDKRSDSGYARPASFYVERLAKRGLVHIGSSLFVREKTIPVVPWELDRGMTVVGKAGEDHFVGGSCTSSSMLGTSEISIRRFFARPCPVSFSATGSNSP